MAEGKGEECQQRLFNCVSRFKPLPEKWLAQTPQAAQSWSQRDCPRHSPCREFFSGLGGDESKHE